MSEHLLQKSPPNILYEEAIESLTSQTWLIQFKPLLVVDRRGRTYSEFELSLLTYVVELIL